MNARTKAVFLASAFLCLLWAFDVRASDPADEFVKSCTATPTKVEDSLKQVLCLGYISGVLDCYSVVSGLHPGVKLYCAPKKGIPVGEALDALVEWLRAHPNESRLPVRSALLMALTEKFPCR